MKSSCLTAYLAATRPDAVPVSPVGYRSALRRDRQNELSPK
jgi:hypothetical protein